MGPTISPAKKIKISTESKDGHHNDVMSCHLSQWHSTHMQHHGGFRQFSDSGICPCEFNKASLKQKITKNKKNTYPCISVICSMPSSVKIRFHKLFFSTPHILEPAALRGLEWPCEPCESWALGDVNGNVANICKPHWFLLIISKNLGIILIN